MQIKKTSPLEESQTRLPASRSSSFGPESCFLFLRPKIKGGGRSFDKTENHGLKMHFKSFKAILVNVVFLTHTPHPLIQPEGRCHLMKGKAWSKNEFYVVLSQVLPSEILSSQRVGMPSFHF